MSIDSPTLLFILISCGGVFVGAVVGFAAALVAVPFLILVLSPKLAVPAFTLLTLASNLVVAIEGRRHLVWGTVGWLMAGGLAGTLVGAWALKMLPVDLVRLVVSGVTLLFGLLFLAKVPLRLREHPAVDLGTGLLSGWLGGCISQSGPPMVVYALARGWAKEAFRANLMAYFFVMNLFALGAYWQFGLLSARCVTLAALAVVPALAVSWVGLLVKNRISERHFRLAVLVIILLVGVAGVVTVVGK
jgi:uncharacterized membrane protein YfcA